MGLRPVKQGLSEAQYHVAIERLSQVVNDMYSTNTWPGGPPRPKDAPIHAAFYTASNASDTRRVAAATTTTTTTTSSSSPHIFDFFGQFANIGESFASRTSFTHNDRALAAKKARNGGKGVPDSSRYTKKPAIACILTNTVEKCTVDLKGALVLSVTEDDGRFQSTDACRLERFILELSATNFPLSPRPKRMNGEFCMISFSFCPQESSFLGLFIYLPSCFAVLVQLAYLSQGSPNLAAEQATNPATHGIKSSGKGSSFSIE